MIAADEGTGGPESGDMFTGGGEDADAPGEEASYPVGEVNVTSGLLSFVTIILEACSFLVSKSSELRRKGVLGRLTSLGRHNGRQRHGKGLVRPMVPLDCVASLCVLCTGTRRSLRSLASNPFSLGLRRISHRHHNLRPHEQKRGSLDGCRESSDSDETYMHSNPHNADVSLCVLMSHSAAVHVRCEVHHEAHSQYISTFKFAQILYCGLGTHIQIDITRGSSAAQYTYAIPRSGLDASRRARCGSVQAIA